MKLTLNLGCGERTFKEYPEGYICINYDERPDLSEITTIGDVKRLPFTDKCFDYVLASDIIEHFPISFTERLLREWCRVLVPGGIIEFRTPNLKWCAQHYLLTGDASFVSYHIFGGQDYAGNFHFVIFDRKWLKELLTKHNLFEISYEENGSNFIMKARKN